VHVLSWAQMLKIQRPSVFPKLNPTPRAHLAVSDTLSFDTSRSLLTLAVSDTLSSTTHVVYYGTLRGYVTHVMQILKIQRPSVLTI